MAEAYGYEVWATPPDRRRADFLIVRCPDLLMARAARHDIAKQPCYAGHTIYVKGYRHDGIVEGTDT